MYGPIWTGINESLLTSSGIYIFFKGDKASTFIFFKEGGLHSGLMDLAPSTSSSNSLF